MEEVLETLLDPDLCEGKLYPWYSSSMDWKVSFLNVFYQTLLLWSLVFLIRCCGTLPQPFFLIKKKKKKAFSCIGSQLWHVGSPLHPHCGAGTLSSRGAELSCSTARGIIVPRPGIRSTSPEVQGQFLITEPPGKSLYFSLLRCGLWRGLGWA